MEKTKDDRIAELENAMAELVNASLTPMTKARYAYLESVRAKCALLLGKPNARIAYFISELEKMPDGGYRALIATEGELGYRKTEWNWGKDKKEADGICQTLNKSINVDLKTAMIIQLRSMRQS